MRRFSDLAEIIRDIREFVVSNFLFGENGDGLNDRDSFLEKGIMDSTGVLELIAFIQEHFGIAIDDQEITPDNLDSVEKVARFVGGKKGVES
jgi:acyl carrier protein